jgi:hypothetical protein
MKASTQTILLWLFAGPAALSAAASGGTEFGTIHLADDLTLTVRRSIKATEVMTTLSPGQYDLDRWIIHRRDTEGILWTCEGSVPEDKRLFEVVADREVELPIGEPILSVLSAERRGYEITFRHRLQGRLGERIRIERDGKRSQAPMLRIRNAEGYEKTLTFEYG